MGWMQFADRGAMRRGSGSLRHPPCSHRTESNREHVSAPTERPARRLEPGARQTPSFPGSLSASPEKLLHRQLRGFLAYLTHGIKTIEPGCSRRLADLPGHRYDPLPDGASRFNQVD